jgi:hypothetical protein
VLTCAPINFPLYGAAGTWPLRFLSMMDGRTGPEHLPWAITLAHTDGNQFVLVTSCPRDWYHANMVGPDGDVAEEVAFSLAVVQVNLALAVTDRAVIDSNPGLVKALNGYIGPISHGYRAWPRAQWTVRGGGLPADSGTASVTSLAGWRSGFTLDHPDLFLIVHAYGPDPAWPDLVPVTDTAAYGFDAAAPVLASAPAEGFPHRSDRLHPDLRKVLADAEDPGHRDVGHGQVHGPG